MSLIDEIKNEIETCDMDLAACRDEIRACNETLIKLNEREANLSARKTILNNILTNALEEQEKLNKLKAKLSGEKAESGRKKKSAEPSVKTDTEPEVEAEEPAESIDTSNYTTMKDLAAELNIQSTEIAHVVNTKNIIATMTPNGYGFSPEQVEQIRAEFNKT